jgi:hypothetical protein
MHRTPRPSVPRFPRRAAPALLLGLGAAACAPVRYVEAFAPAEAVREVVVRSASGDVELVAGDALWIERSIRAASGSLDLRHEVRDGSLLLDARCTAWLPCPVDVRVVVPEGVAVRVELGSGEVWATDIGALDLALGDGRADLDLRGPLQAHVGSGTVELALPAGAQARVAVADGDVLVDVPAGPWQLRATGAEVETSGVEVDDAAAGSLELTAPSGRIAVLGGGELALR